MISIILAGLMAFTQPSINANYTYNNATVDMTSHISVNPLYEVQDGSNWGFMGYHVSMDDSIPSESPFYFNINTTAGTLPLKFVWNVTSRSGYYWYSLQITYNSDETYRSNLYLNNFKVQDEDNGDWHQLPNVFFNGNPDVMDSTEDTTFGFDFDYATTNFVYSFDLCIVPSSMIDTGESYTTGYEDGYSAGNSAGQQTGWSQGYQDGLATAEQGTFHNLFNSIADTPLRFLYGLFNFDLFGTSMLVIVLSLLTAIVLFGVFKKFWK